MLKRKNVIILIIALIFGFAGVLLVMNYVNSVKTVYNDRPMSEVIVAAQDIPEYTRITKGMLQTTNIQSEYVMPQASNKTEDIVGAMTTTRIFKGEQIMKGRFSKGGTPAEFVYGIPEGKRAMSFALDPIRGVAGFIKPHDRLDIILTLTPPGAGQDKQQAQAGAPANPNDSSQVFMQIAKKLLEGRRFITFDGTNATFTLYQNIEVLAVGKKVNNSDKDNPEQNGSSNTITLCLDPEQVEILTNAEKVGTIKYDLRNPGDESIVHLNPIVEYRPN